MRVLPPSPRSLNLAVAALAAGGLVIHPTETCYGIACDLTNPAAIARLFALKQRPGNQPVSALFSSVADAQCYTLWNATAEELARKFLPGPLTLLLPLRNNAPHAIFLMPPNEQRATSNEQRHIGIRLSSHPVAQKLVTRFGKPISTTSANISGRQPAYSVEEILLQFRVLTDAPDIILDYGPLPHAPPSTILRIDSDDVMVLREGGCLRAFSLPPPAPSAGV